MSDALGAPLLSHMKLGVVCSSPKLLRGRGRLERAQQLRAVVAALAEDPGSSQHPHAIAGLFCPHRHSMEMVLRRAYRPDPRTHKVKQINLPKFKITLNYTANLKLALAT